MARALALWLVCLLLSTGSAAHASAPASYVHDTTRALEPELQASLESELARFHAETGVLLLVKAVSFIDPGATMRTSTRIARRELAPEGPVALIMIDRGKNGLGISQSPELWQRYPLAEMVEVLRAALVAASDDLPLDEKLVVASRRWLEDIRSLEARRRLGERVIQERDRPLLLAFVCLLGVGSVAGFRLAARERQRLTLQQQGHPFPEVSVSTRLGAPFGGGRMVTGEGPF